MIQLKLMINFYYLIWLALEEEDLESRQNLPI
jgi:hypothetical protein